MLFPHTQEPEILFKEISQFCFVADGKMAKFVMDNLIISRTVPKLYEPNNESTAILEQ